ncbi:MAG: DUF4332 domain-containing protein [Candidatus Sericytochromatia bacterium]|nr:DUF4332 domain-containing protein [Candidatus Tanganyikabacteria bacterium]
MIHKPFAVFAVAVAMLPLTGCGAVVAPAASLAAAVVQEEDELDAMRAYPVADLLGVGKVYAERLAKAGITNTDQLKAKTATRADRERLARAADIPYGRLLPIAQAVELMRIKGIGVRQANLLQAVGVASVKEMAQRVPANLHERLGIANNISRPFVQRTPGLTTVTRWIGEARSLARSGQTIGG